MADTPEQNEMTDVPMGDNNDAPKTTEEETKKSNPTKMIIGVLFLAFIVYIIVDSFTARRVGGFVQDFLEWFENNIYAGAFLFIAGTWRSAVGGVLPVLTKLLPSLYCSVRYLSLIHI